jgi:hypothetical protein
MTALPITRPAISPLSSAKNHRWLLVSPSPDFACAVVLRCWLGIVCNAPISPAARHPATNGSSAESDYRKNAVINQSDRP